MSDYLTCKYCHGYKKVIGMGGMEKLCPECNGQGYVKKPIDVADALKIQTKLDRVRRKKERRLKRFLHGVSKDHPLNKIDNKVIT